VRVQFQRGKCERAGVSTIAFLEVQGIEIVVFSSLQFSPSGRVGEWLKPADCKSAAPCGLRRFESYPVHQFSLSCAGTKLGDARSKSCYGVRAARVSSCLGSERVPGLGSSGGRARPW
jgi:hypothetical protein